MLSIAQISDLHFGPTYLPHVGEAVLRKLGEMRLDAIVASGDFTQRATAEQFVAARDFLRLLPEVPLLVIPGNHDVPLYRFWERLLQPYRHYQQYISSELDQVMTLDGAILVGLNSTAPYTAIKNGRIRQHQLEYCERALLAAPEDCARVVVAHHHFAPAPDYQKSQIMPKAKRAMERFQQLDVELILGGHLHRAYVGNSLDVFPGVNRDRGIIIVQSGTTTSRRGRAREREKNSFNLIEIDHETIQVTHLMYFHEDNQFNPVSRHLFPRPGRRRLPASVDSP